MVGRKYVEIQQILLQIIFWSFGVLFMGINMGVV